MNTFSGFCLLLTGYLIDLTHTQSTQLISGSEVNVSGTCIEAVTACMSGVTGSSSSCQVVKNQFDCYSQTRTQDCTVDESLVTFDSIQPVVIGVCEQLSKYTTCYDFLWCQSDNIFYNLTASIDQYTGPSGLHASSLTSTRFWCQYLTHGLHCFTLHNKTCNAPSADIEAITSQKNWIQHTCSGQGNTVTSKCRKEVNKCLATANSDDVFGSSCSSQLTEMSCLSGTGQYCSDHNDTLVSFEDLFDVFRDTCTVVSEVVNKGSGCFTLEECLKSTEYAQMPGLDDEEGPPTAVYPYLLSSGFWCSYMIQVVNCYNSKALLCGVSTDRQKAMEIPRKSLLKACKVEQNGNNGFNSAAVKVPTSSTSHVTLLITAVLTSLFHRYFNNLALERH